MPKRTELEGKTFGFLTVSSRLGVSPTTKRVYWNCECICGKTVKKSTTALRRTKLLHCGCQAVSNEIISRNQLMLRYKHTAKGRKLKFDLLPNVFLTLIKGNCFYCNAAPHRLYQSTSCERAKMLYNGIDRKNSSDGYIESNCVSCCWTCNQAKRDMSFDSFKKWIKAVHDNVYNSKEKETKE